MWRNQPYPQRHFSKMAQYHNQISTLLGVSPEFPKQLSCIPFRFSCGGLRKGLLTFGTRVKRPFAQSAARHPKIAQSYKSHNNSPKFQLFSGFLPRISWRARASPQAAHQRSSIFALKKVLTAEPSTFGNAAVAVSPSEKSLSETVAEEIGWSAGFLNASSVAAP